MRFFILLKKHGRLLTSFFFLIAALLLMTTVRFASPDFADRLRTTLTDLTAPVQRLLSTPFKQFRTLQDQITRWSHLEEQNETLRHRIQQIERQLNLMEEISQENRRLRALIDLSPPPEWRALGARVVGNASSVFSKVYLLDRGEESGVSKDAIVMSARGVVGRVAQLGNRSALVLTLLDINSHIPILIQHARAHAIASGKNDAIIQLDFLSEEADIHPGDRVLTSGRGGLFPKGLPVGRVLSVATPETSLFQNVTVQPFTDFDRLEEVRILTLP